MIKHNTGISRDFIESIHKEKESGENWIAEIPEKKFLIVQFIIKYQLVRWKI
ncbi:hypothetical protein [Lactobacillus helveticus]|uniref:hypothetical protein n=1 Tax=Lactobacillus helveticus TaxID=1587 RepID=UPI00386E23BB